MANGTIETSSQSQEQPEQQQQQGVGGLPSRAKMVQRLLQATGNLPQFLHDLLSTMAVVVAGTEAAGFIIERVPGDVDAEGKPTNFKLSLRPLAHIRPDDSGPEVRAQAIKAFQEIISPCVEQGKDGAIEVGSPDGGEPQFCLVTLLRSEGSVVAAAAVVTRCRDQERARQRLMSMQLVAGYFEMFKMRRDAEQAKSIAQNQQNVLQLSAAIGTAEGFESAAMNLCNEIAQRIGASRVSIGWLKGKSIKVKALSHTEKFDKKQELIVQIEKAMEECLDQEEVVRFDCDGERSENVTRAHETLSRAQGNNTIVSLPLHRKDGVEGVVTCEFAPPQKLNEQMIDALVVATEVLAPQLHDRFENDRWLIVKAGHSTKNVAKLAIGPKHMLAKLVIALVIGAGFFVTFFRPMYHVSAPFQFAAVGKQTLCAPFEGTIERINIRPGDKVKAGDVLVELRTIDLRSELIRSRSDASAKRKQALALRNNPDPTKRNLGEAAALEEEAKAKDAEADYIESKIRQASIKAPFDGVVLRAELEDKGYAAVKTGDPLLEIAPSNELRAEAAVSEKDIQELHVGQHGTLATSSYPGRDIEFIVDRIVPLGSEAKEGDNVFKVYFTLKTGQPWMRPGMAGEAKVDIEKRRLVWVWTHRLVDFLRLKLWM